MLTALDHRADKVATCALAPTTWFKPLIQEVVACVGRAGCRGAGPGQPDALVQAGAGRVIPWACMPGCTSGRHAPEPHAHRVPPGCWRWPASPGRVFSRQELAAQAQMGEDAQDRTVDSHLSKLRKKTGAGCPSCLPARGSATGSALVKRAGGTRVGASSARWPSPCQCTSPLVSCRASRSTSWPTAGPADDIGADGADPLAERFAGVAVAVATSPVRMVPAGDAVAPGGRWLAAGGRGRPLGEVAPAQAWDEAAVGTTSTP